MGRIWVKEFTGGLDTRRLPETTPGGVLIKGQDGHINSGGEFEKRAAFVSTYTLPAGTVSLAYTRTGVFVFGSAVSPSMPAGVTYQRLQKGAKVLVDVLSFDLYAGKLYVVAQYDDGTIVHFYDGTEVTDWFDGRARASFTVTGGVAADTMTSLQVNGVNILNGTITWATSHVATAALIAASINAATSSPDYSATAVGTQVNIIAATAGSGPNGFSIIPVLTGAFAITPPSGLFLANGADSTSTFTPGTFVKTLGRKEYSVSDGVFHFSGVAEPTKWTSDTTGAGFFDLSTLAADAEELLAVANYQGFAAVFAEQVIVIMYVDPDPDLVRESQILENTGTVAPRSVTQFGDSDLFYLALSGLRSLKARDASNAAATTDLGVPVDGLVTAKLAAMTVDERKGVIGLVNPVDGRFWLCFPDGTIFVFSFYPSAKVSAWTTYSTGFVIDDAVVFGRRVHIRSGDKIYVYGGLGDVTYDNTVAKCWLPYLEADQPSQFKGWQGIDAAVRGTWEVKAGTQLGDEYIDQHELIATLGNTTFNSGMTTYNGLSTHTSLRFESTGTGAAKVSAAILHYEGGEDG